MRDAVWRSGVAARPQDAHPGLWWSRIAPIPEGAGEGLRPEDKDTIIDEMCMIGVPDFYARAFATWRASIAPRAYLWEFEATSRLLVGHGEPSAIGIGITLHPIYGVPWIPGSAVKGILSHHLGLSGIAEWAGVQYQDKRGELRILGDGAPVIGPGQWTRALFGAPAIPRFRDHPAEEAEQGVVTFEDAWLMPGDDPKVLVRDVLTPHQKKYYDKQGLEQPVDWDDPNPVGFVTVKPGVRFLFALGVQPVHATWAELAFKHLRDALIENGIGGKTSVGYGHFRSVTQAPIPPLAARSEALEAFLAALARVAELAEGKVPAFRKAGFLALAAAVPAQNKREARAAFSRLAEHKKIARELATLVAEVRGELDG